MKIAVGGRDRDAVVPGELSQPAAADEPAQHEHSLPEDAQCAGVLAGAEPLAVPAQQLREVLGGRPYPDTRSRTNQRLRLGFHS